jgi:hypothetical protein
MLCPSCAAVRDRAEDVDVVGLPVAPSPVSRSAVMEADDLDRRVLLGLLLGLLVAASIVLAIVALASGPSARRDFRDDNAYGATANAAERLEARAQQLLWAALSLLSMLAAALVQIARHAAAVRRDLAAQRPARSGRAAPPGEA